MRFEFLVIRKESFTVVVHAASESEARARMEEPSDFCLHGDVAHEEPEIRLIRRSEE